MRSALAVVVAAGNGVRLGAGVPKAFIEVAGRPMVQWSVDALRAAPGIGQIVVALPEGATAPPGSLGVPGGRTRSESVRAALAASGPGDPVLVQDAARPLLVPALVELVLAAVSQNGVDGAVAAAPVTDTVKRVDGSRRVLETVDRSALWAVQTPQAFRRGALEDALRAESEVLAAATDDAWLLERSGATVVVVPWSEDNLKVTSPRDLRQAELLLTSRREQVAGAPDAD